MTITEILSRGDLFTDLSTEQLAAIATYCQEVTCPEGNTLFREGQEATQLFILLKGKVNLQVWLAAQRQNITVEVISQPYQTIGWSGLVTPYYYTATALCLANSRLLALDGQVFLRLLEQDPVTGFVVMRRITKVICDRLRNSRVALLKFIDAEGSEN